MERLSKGQYEKRRASLAFARDEPIMSKFEDAVEAIVGAVSGAVASISVSKESIDGAYRHRDASGDGYYGDASDRVASSADDTSPDDTVYLNG